MEVEYRFDYLKNKLFPYWDLNQEWKVSNNHKMIKEIENKLGSKFIGYCDKESKTIFLEYIQYTKQLFREIFSLKTFHENHFNHFLI